MTRTFLPALACTLWVWICDLPFVPVYAVCMAATPWRFYFWNSIKADDKAKTFTE